MIRFGMGSNVRNPYAEYGLCWGDGFDYAQGDCAGASTGYTSGVGFDYIATLGYGSGPYRYGFIYDTYLCVSPDVWRKL